ncbi:hypothetical protein [Kitasatospora sp. NPDC004531]
MKRRPGPTEDREHAACPQQGRLPGLGQDPRRLAEPVLAVVRDGRPLRYSDPVIGAVRRDDRLIVARESPGDPSAPSAR